MGTIPIMNPKNGPTYDFPIGIVELADSTRGTVHLSDNVHGILHLHPAIEEQQILYFIGAVHGGGISVPVVDGSEVEWNIHTLERNYGIPVVHVPGRRVTHTIQMDLTSTTDTPTGR